MFVFFFLMLRRPPRSTRTDTLFPYTTLFRSSDQCARQGGLTRLHQHAELVDRELADRRPRAKRPAPGRDAGSDGRRRVDGAAHTGDDAGVDRRSEERRVGKECVSTCTSWWSQYT